MPRHIEPDEAVIRTLLLETGSVKRAADRLGVSRRTLGRWIKKLGIRVDRQIVIEDAA